MINAARSTSLLAAYVGSCGAALCCDVDMDRFHDGASRDIQDIPSALYPAFSLSKRIGRFEIKLHIDGRLEVIDHQEGTVALGMHNCNSSEGGCTLEFGEELSSSAGEVLVLTGVCQDHVSELAGEAPGEDSTSLRIDPIIGPEKPFGMPNFAGGIAIDPNVRPPLPPDGTSRATGEMLIEQPEIELLSAADQGAGPAEAVSQIPVIRLEFACQLGQIEGQNDATTLQRKLLASGFDPGPIDGIIGPLTLDAGERLWAQNGHEFSNLTLGNFERVFCE